MKKETIPIASDHPGFELKEALKQYLLELGYQPLDLGTYSKERVDYPVYSLSVADKVSKGQYEKGIVICKTGVGVSIVANKFPGIRAALIRNPEIAKLTREHNDTNVLALGAGVTPLTTAKEIVKIWLTTEPEGGRHQRRIEQIALIEKHNLLPGERKLKSGMLLSASLNDALGNGEKISASLMCANQLNLLQDVRALEKVGIDFFHIDIIDGNFAKNVSMNLDHVAQLRNHTTVPLDVHLMVKDPTTYIPRLAEAGANIVTIHVESEGNLEYNLNQIKTLGMKAGLAIEVYTPLEKIYPYINRIDLVMFMTVYTGFKATQLVPQVFDKIKSFAEYKRENNLSLPIMVDGSVGPRSIPHLYRAGARIFVGGTSGLFKDGTFAENLKQMRSFCN